MRENTFFKPTVLYKEYIILDLIEKNKNITQREIGEIVGVAVSMVNDYLEEYEKCGLISRIHFSTKTVEYFVTKTGLERRKLLNLWYLKSSYNIYKQAKINIIQFINQVIEKGFQKILLYGAGEVAEIIINVMNDDHTIPLEVLAIIDDDPKRQNTVLFNIPIISNSKLNDFPHEGILISSYKHNDVIFHKLCNLAYPKDKIIHFFENQV